LMLHYSTTVLMQVVKKMESAGSKSIHTIPTSAEMQTMQTPSPPNRLISYNPSPSPRNCDPTTTPCLLHGYPQRYFERDRKQSINVSAASHRSAAHQPHHHKPTSNQSYPGKHQPVSGRPKTSFPLPKMARYYLSAGLTARYRRTFTCTQQRHPTHPTS
jgi:hypothetical protein